MERINITKIFEITLDDFLQMNFEIIKKIKQIGLNIKYGNVWSIAEVKGFLNGIRFKGLCQFLQDFYVRRKYFNGVKYQYKEISPFTVQNNKVIFLSGFYPLLTQERYPQVHKDLLDLNNADSVVKILRDYQKEALRLMVKNCRGVIEAPTGSGKTLMYISFVKLLKPNVNVLIVVPKSQVLLEQTVDNFLKFFDKNEIGFCYGGGKRYARIMIASPMKALELSLNAFDCVIVDECHTVPSNTIKKILVNCKNAKIRFGFSGTAEGRSDEADFLTMGLLGMKLCSIPYQDLQEKGFLSQMNFEFWIIDSIHYNDEYLLLRNTNNWHTIVNRLILGNDYRQEIILKAVNELMKEKRNCLIIVERKEHGRILENKLKGKYKVVFISSENRSKNYKIINDFRNGKIQILIATQLIEFGIDIPNLESIILASIGKSYIQFYQRLGRGLRPAEGKVLKVIDIVDKVHPIFLRHYYQRRKYLKEKGFEIKEKHFDKIPEREHFDIKQNEIPKKGMFLSWGAYQWLKKF